jgi:hypothetical protein
VITEHTICALDEDNTYFRHFAIKVQRRGNGEWVLANGSFFYAGDTDWLSSIRDAFLYDEAGALSMAEDLKSTIEVNGLTVADALELGRR